MAVTFLLHMLADEDSGTGSVLVWSLFLIFFVVALFVAVAYLRKRLSPDEDFHGEGFTLSDLRRMHKAGRMTDDEFERAKHVLLQTMKAAAPAPGRPNDLPGDLPGGGNLRS